MANTDIPSLQSFTLPLRRSVVHGWKMGDGARCVIAFHGFSENALAFKELWPAMPADTMLVALDFPYHGYTDWREESFTPDDLHQLVQQLLHRFQVTRFSLMGFSMGGRLALSLVPRVAHQLDRLILLAPDGIQTHKVFDMAVYPVWGRWAFRLVTKKPQLFFFAVRMLYRSGRLSRFIYEFTINHMDTAEKRHRIFHTWQSLKHFVPDIPAVQEILRAHRVPVHLLFGATDQVIRPAIGKRFVRQMPEATLDIVPKGHKLVDKVSVPYLQRLFNS